MISALKVIVISITTEDLSTVFDVVTRVKIIQKDRFTNKYLQTLLVGPYYKHNIFRERFKNLTTVLIKRSLFNFLHSILTDRCWLQGNYYMRR